MEIHDHVNKFTILRMDVYKSEYIKCKPRINMTILSTTYFFFLVVMFKLDLILLHGCRGAARDAFFHRAQQQTRLTAEQTLYPIPAAGPPRRPVRRPTGAEEEFPEQR